MKTLKDYSVTYTALEHDSVVRKFEGNLWTWQETFRQVFGPGSHIDKLVSDWNGKERIFVDPVDWGDPKCCPTCKTEAVKLSERLKAKNDRITKIS